MDSTRNMRPLREERKNVMAILLRDTDNSQVENVLEANDLLAIKQRET